MTPSLATPIAPKTPPAEPQTTPQEPLFRLNPQQLSQLNVANKIRQLLIYSAHEVVAITEKGLQSISKENLCWPKALTTEQFIAHLSKTALVVSQEDGEYRLTALIIRKRNGHGKKSPKIKKPHNFPPIVVSSVQPSSSSSKSSTSVSTSVTVPPLIDQGSNVLLETLPQPAMLKKFIKAIAKDAISQLSPKSKQILQNMGQDAALRALLLKQLKKVPEIHSLSNKTDRLTRKKRFILVKNIGFTLNKLLHNKFMVRQEQGVFDEDGIKFIIEDTIENTLHLPKKPANTIQIMYKTMFSLSDEITLSLTKNRSQEELIKIFSAEPPSKQEIKKREKVFDKLIKPIIDDVIKNTSNIESTTHSQQEQSDATTIPPVPSRITIEFIEDIVNEAMLKLSPESIQVLQNMKQHTALQALLIEPLKKIPELHSLTDKTDFSILKKLKYLPLEEKIGIALNKLLHNKIMVDQQRGAFDEVGIKSIIDDVIEDTLPLQKRTSNATRIVYKRILDLSPEDQLALINDRPQEEVTQTLSRLIDFIDSSLKQSNTTTIRPTPSQKTMALIRFIVTKAMSQLSSESMQILQSMKRVTALQELLTKQLKEAPTIHSLADKTDLPSSEKRLELENRIGMDLNKILLNEIMVAPKRDVFDEFGIKTIIDRVIENALQKKQEQPGALTISCLRSEVTIETYKLILSFSLEEQRELISRYPQGVAPVMIDSAFQQLVAKIFSNSSQ